MIRQLPRLAMPKFIQNQTGAPSEPMTAATDVKIYDVITPSTINNSDGNTMQLQLFQKDSEVNEGVRELHGRIVLNTESLPDKQALRFGFMFASNSDEGKYDGLQVATTVDSLYNHSDFVHTDISALNGDKPSVYDVFENDTQNDWVILPEASSVSCEDVGRCEISVAFVRNFDTLDKEQDISLKVGEELEYSLFGFYETRDLAGGSVRHLGQS